MTIIKSDTWKIFEIILLIFAYMVLIINAFVYKDSTIAVSSAFFGITYTMLAGKGIPKCYLFGLAGSFLYSWLSYSNALWGNLALYMLYYIPMQTIGFFKWHKHLKKDKNEIIKTKLIPREALYICLITIILTLLCISGLFILNDRSPVIDGITTIFSIVGMYLTVKRCVEQWTVWIIVNGLSTIMWINIALNGEKVFSTVFMWLIYFILAIYFYKNWHNEIKNNTL